MFLRPSFLVAVVASVLVSVATEVSAKDFQRFSTGIDAVQFTDAGGRQLKGSKSCKASRRLNGKVRRAKSYTGGGSSSLEWLFECIRLLICLLKKAFGGRRLETECVSGSYSLEYETFRSELNMGFKNSGLFTPMQGMVLDCVFAIAPMFMNDCQFKEAAMYVLSFEDPEEYWETKLGDALTNALDELEDAEDEPLRRLSGDDVAELKVIIVTFFNEESFPEPVKNLISNTINYVPLGFMLNGGEPIENEEPSEVCSEDS